LKQVEEEAEEAEARHAERNGRQDKKAEETNKCNVQTSEQSSDQTMPSAAQQY
jgi:hypothetical protein